MGDVPTFSVVGPFRCCWSGGLKPETTCNSLAEFMSAARPGLPGRLWCAAHAPETAGPIAGSLLVRRVSVSAEIIFTGHGITPGYDQAEAVAQLERAIEAIGGTLNLHAATSVMGRYEAPPLRQVGPGRRRGA